MQTHGVHGIDDVSYIKRLAIAKTLWIEALCINQSNIMEREQQVAMMGRIYRQSQGAVIWLGPLDSYSESFSRMLDTIAKNSQDNPDTVERMRGPQEILSSKEQVRALGLPDPVAWDWVCFWATLNRAWFRRTWVVQELSLASEAIVILGDHQITGGMFVLLANVLKVSLLAKEVEDWV
jgi:hypothetical protein